MFEIRCVLASQICSKQMFFDSRKYNFNRVQWKMWGKSSWITNQLDRGLRRFLSHLFPGLRQSNRRLRAFLWDIADITFYLSKILSKHFFTLRKESRRKRHQFVCEDAMLVFVHKYEWKIKFILNFEVDRLSYVGTSDKKCVLWLRSYHLQLTIATA